MPEIDSKKKKKNYSVFYVLKYGILALVFFYYVWLYISWSDIKLIPIYVNYQNLLFTFKCTDNQYNTGGKVERNTMRGLSIKYKMQWTLTK